jgi:hypothetical protein
MKFQSNTNYYEIKSLFCEWVIHEIGSQRCKIYRLATFGEGNKMSPDILLFIWPSDNRSMIMSIYATINNVFYVDVYVVRGLLELRDILQSDESIKIVCLFHPSLKKYGVSSKDSLLHWINDMIVEYSGSRMDELSDANTDTERCMNCKKPMMQLLSMQNVCKHGL